MLPGIQTSCLFSGVAERGKLILGRCGLEKGFDKEDSGRLLPDLGGLGPRNLSGVSFLHIQGSVDVSSAFSIVQLKLRGVTPGYCILSWALSGPPECVRLHFGMPSGSA